MILHRAVLLRFVDSVNELPSLFNENFSHTKPRNFFLMFASFLLSASRWLLSEDSTLDSLGSHHERKKLTTIINCLLSYQNIVISYQYCTYDMYIMVHRLKINKIWHIAQCDTFIATESEVWGNISTKDPTFPPKYLIS